ncbi:DNA polymerase III subunit delta [Candidatus Epulonipiscioides gigas]|nr:DNA polymerase III subunit delta [Epulopiscium sp. SCG-C07WGA-EpuloA2]
MNECYLIYGKDNYLKNRRLQQLKSNIISADDMMNYTIFDGKNCDINKIIEEAETFPFFSEKKVIVVKESGLFIAGRKNDSEKILLWLKNFPQYLYLIFLESKIDKRTMLYKTISKIGQVEEFDFISSAQIGAIINQEFNNPVIPNNVFNYFLARMPQDINYILLEFEKLQSYCGKNSITITDIDEVCTLNLEQKIFDLVKLIVKQDTTRALNIYLNLIASKEQPLGILGLIAKQYRNMLQIKDLLKEFNGSREISQIIQIPEFAVRDIISLSQKFENTELVSALKLCLETDRNIKTGKYEAIHGVEFLILNLCIKNQSLAQTI